MEKLKKRAVISIKVLDIHSQKHRAQHVGKRNFYSLSYRYTGKIKIEAEGRQYISEAGSITFIPKKKGYRTEVLADTHMVAVHFDLAREVETEGVCVIEDKEGVLKPYFDRLGATYTGAEPWDFDVMALFYQLLSELSVMDEAEHAVSPVAMLAKKEIDKSFSQPSLAISSVSHQLGISDSYLRRVFRGVYGMSPMEYLTAVRIRCAKNLLESEFLSIDQIGALCGFQSVGYFIQCFRKETGETPGAYRNRRRRS